MASVSMPAMSSTSEYLTNAFDCDIEAVAVDCLIALDDSLLLGALTAILDHLLVRSKLSLKLLPAADRLELV